MGQPSHTSDHPSAVQQAVEATHNAPPGSQQQKEALSATYNRAADAPADSANLNAPAPGSAASQLPPEALALATRLFDYARAGDTAALTQYVRAGIPPNLTNGSGDTLLMLAAYHNHVETVKALLELGADANALNDKGQSPLAGAVFKGYTEVVRVLVQQGQADATTGQPNAVETAHMFRREDLLELLGAGSGGSSNGNANPSTTDAPSQAS